MRNLLMLYSRPNNVQLYEQFDNNGRQLVLIQPCLVLSAIFQSIFLERNYIEFSTYRSENSVVQRWRQIKLLLKSTLYTINHVCCKFSVS